MAIAETAYAKINLALHVRRRREDGYHELETLFAFVDAGDVLTASNAAQDSVNVLGEFAEHVHAVLRGVGRRQHIARIDEGEQRFQLVIPILAPPADMQREVDLGVCSLSNGHA